MSSKSNFWSKLAISRKDSESENSLENLGKSLIDLPEGIVSKEKPLSFPKEKYEISENEFVDTIVNDKIDKDELYFFLQHSQNASGNSHILDPKLGENNIVIKLVNSENKKQILGFISSIPHQVMLIPDDKSELPQLLDFCATSNLCVSHQHRKKNLAALLISGVINKGFEEGMYVGYHYIKEPKSLSSVRVYNYYRPLNIQEALDSGFEIPSFRLAMFKLKKNFQAERQEYKASHILGMEQEYFIPRNKDYKIQESKYEDLEFLGTQNRKLYVSLTSERFEELKKYFVFKTVRSNKNHRIVSVFCYNPKILVIGASQKACPTASMVLLEMVSYRKNKILFAILEHLRDLRFVSVAGSLYGPLYDDELRKEAKLIVSGQQYLDFYNLHVNLENKPSNFNLFYY